MIEVRNLVKRYGGHTAVDNLSFTVEEGQIYGFLGPNGAGKSTTMNIMTGYLGATEGEVIINGHNILEEPEKAKKCIGYLPEMPPLYNDMTVMEYLKFAAELKKIKKQDRDNAIQEAISLTRLSDVQGRLIKNLSKGYKQRVGLAQAVLGFPEVIILDEPTVGLDPKQIIEIRDLIKTLSKKHTVILSSHILSEVSAVCDFVMIIAHGKLVASDTPENLEKMMTTSNRLELTIKADINQTKEVLQKLPDITILNIQENREDGKEVTTDVTIQPEEGKDIREEAFYTFADNRCPLLMMKTEHVSLEDVFLELTSEKKTVNEGKKKRKFRLKGGHSENDLIQVMLDEEQEEESITEVFDNNLDDEGGVIDDSDI